MFSFKQRGELVYNHEIPGSISFRNPQDLIVNLHDHVNMEGNTNLPASKPRTKRQRDHESSSKLNMATIVGGKDEDMYRKLVHREVERKRRKDVSQLYASLGDLLPLDFAKGKRSVQDHIHQAVNYIKHMEENVNVLSAKRDQLQKFVETSEKESLMNLFPNTVSISFSYRRSIEIQINSCLLEDGFPFSEVLKALIDEGLDVISCTCKNVNNRLLHSIQSEASDTTILTNIYMFQQRLSVIANN